MPDEKRRFVQPPVRRNGVRVDTRTDSGAANSELLETGYATKELLCCLFDLARVAGKLLPERHGNRVLQCVRPILRTR